jgi:hypothetical protein
MFCTGVNTMIDKALSFLRDRLNTHLGLGQDPDESMEDLVVFVDGQNMEPLTFKLGAVSVLLINIEEDNTLHARNPYLRTSSDGARLRVSPDIRLNLYVLFVARFKQYKESLRYLSLIIRYFQKHRLLDHHSAPELSENIEQLILELITLPFSEQNEVWNALRVTYHPSVLYKVKMIVFQDEDAIAMPELEEKILEMAP